MPAGLKVTMDELHLAWSRVKMDHPDRCFVDQPLLFRLIESDLDGWLSGVQQKLENGYEPHHCQIAIVPKANHLVRPGGVLHLEDEVVYNLLVGRMQNGIFQKIKAFQGDPDVRMALRDPAKGKEWLGPGHDDFRLHRERSVATLAAKPYVLVSDISGFYENIDLDKLRSDLRQIGASEEDLKLLEKCLRKWSYPRDKGIPQGYSASDILAKLYLNSVDQALRNAGLVHTRWMDDFRIFCDSELEGRHAIVRLFGLLSQRGLNLQSAKTRVLNQFEAKKEFEGVGPIIQKVEGQLRVELEDFIAIDNPYLSPRAIGELAEAQKLPPQRILELGFVEHLQNVEQAEFDKTLFHFLLNRLGKVGSRVAVDYSLQVLRSHPQETRWILEYFSDVQLDPDQITKLSDYMTSREIIHDYQLYELLRWFMKEGLENEAVLALSRGLAFDQNREPWLRGVSVGYLGTFGDQSDLEAIEEKYRQTTSEVERAQYIWALRRLEKGRRNSFYGRVAGDGEMVRRAIEFAKSSG